LQTADSSKWKIAQSKTSKQNKSLQLRFDGSVVPSSVGVPASGVTSASSPAAPDAPALADPEAPALADPEAPALADPEAPAPPAAALPEAPPLPAAEDVPAAPVRPAVAVVFEPDAPDDVVAP
jgi:hypothetical protein